MCNMQKVIGSNLKASIIFQKGKVIQDCLFVLS